MATIHDVCTNWVDVHTGNANRYINGGDCRVVTYSDKIYSYGPHFEMARPLRDKRGRVTTFLVNGDTYSVSTSNHQSNLRSAIQRSGVPYVIIPYSALAAAGVERDSVTLLDATADRWEPVHRVSTTLDNLFTDDDGNVWTYGWNGKEPVTVTVRDGRTEYRWTGWRHRLGESVIRARVRMPDGRRRSAKFLSGFDMQESPPLYFFCELPRTSAVTVDEAYEALKPDTVRLAEQMNRPVTRQGDIFAVCLSGQVTKRSLRKAGATFAKRGQLLGTNHVATEVAHVNGTTIARGVLTHTPYARRPDHRRQRLAHGWHVVVKNTVPVTR